MIGRAEELDDVTRKDPSGEPHHCIGMPTKQFHHQRRLTRCAPEVPEMYMGIDDRVRQRGHTNYSTISLTRLSTRDGAGSVTRCSRSSMRCVSGTASSRPGVELSLILTGSQAIWRNRRDVAAKSASVIRGLIFPRICQAGVVPWPLSFWFRWQYFLVTCVANRSVLKSGREIAGAAMLKFDEDSMHSSDSVALWLMGVQQGNADAAQSLWDRYFERLVTLAERKLPAHACRAFDEEDVALSALRCFHQAATAGRYPQLRDQDSLWSLLVVITARKARDYLRREQRKKRGAGDVRGESGFAPAADDGEIAGIEQIVGAEPTPEFAAQTAEECQQLLGLLEDKTLRTIALRKLEGFTVEQIAGQLECTTRTVQRRLTMIRTLWTEAQLTSDE